MSMTMQEYIVRFGVEGLNRLKEIASEKGMNYQSLLKSWVTEKMW